MRCLPCLVCALSLAGVATAHKRLKRQLSIPLLTGVTVASDPSPSILAIDSSTTSNAAANLPISPSNTGTGTSTAAQPLPTTTTSTAIDTSTETLTSTLALPSQNQSAGPGTDGTSSTSSSNTSSSAEISSRSPSVTTSDSTTTPVVSSLSTQVVYTTISGSVQSSASVVVLDASASTTSSGGGGSDSAAWIAPVAVIGGLLGASAVVFVLWWLFKRRRYTFDEPTDFDAGIRWPDVPDDNSHLPPTPLRHTGAAGFGEDATMPHEMAERSPPSKSIASSMFDLSSQPHSPEDHQSAGLYQLHQPVYYDGQVFTSEAPYLATLDGYSDYGGVLNGHIGMQNLQSHVSDQPSSPDRYAPLTPPALPYPAPPGEQELERSGTVRSVQSVADQPRTLGVVNV